MPYIDWDSVEEIYAGTHLKDKTKKEDFNLALHSCEDPQAVLENREAFMQELNHSLSCCVFANQTHSNHIVQIKKDDIAKGAYSSQTSIHDCDALYTREKDILIGVFCADCLPILLYDREQKIIASVHSGWRGSAKHILKKMLDVLKYDEDSEMKDIYAYLGPSIELFSYEVDEVVIDEFKAAVIDYTNCMIDKGDGKYLFDNKMLNYQTLINAGVPDMNIFVSPYDTFTQEDDFFSYRRSQEKGRNLTFILRK